MSVVSKSGRALWRGLSMAAIVAGGLSLVATAASAGSCPADKMDVNVTEPGTMAAKDVADSVPAAMDLAKEPAKLAGRSFRLRRLEVKPGGMVPRHSHGNRPAIIYVVTGEIVEDAGNCAVPIRHKAGEEEVETQATAHWWRNTGSETVVLLSADLLPSKADPHMM